MDGLAGESARSSELAHAAFERLDRFESASRGASAHPSESDGDSDGSSDRATSPGARDYGTEYLVVDHLQNRHWKAREQAEQAEQHPRRYLLYGNETYDLLQQGKHKGGGTLRPCPRVLRARLPLRADRAQRRARLRGPRR